MILQLTWLAAVAVAADGGVSATPKFHLSGPQRIGKVESNDYELSDLYWSGGALCVAQGQKGKQVRCYDPAKAQWGPKEPRGRRVPDAKAQRRSEGFNTRELTADGAADGLACVLGTEELTARGLDVDALAEPLAVEWNQYQTYFREHGDSCTMPFCTEPTGRNGRKISDVVNGCPVAVLFSPDHKHAVAVIPFSAVFTDQKIGRVDFYDETHYALWLYEVDG